MPKKGFITKVLPGVAVFLLLDYLSHTYFLERAFWGYWAEGPLYYLQKGLLFALAGWVMMGPNKIAKAPRSPIRTLPEPLSLALVAATLMSIAYAILNVLYQKPLLGVVFSLAVWSVHFIAALIAAMVIKVVGDCT